MSNRICERCKSSVVVPWNNVKDFYKCMNCSAMGYSEKFPEKTLFNRITASEETLANELVTLDCDGWWAYVGFGKRKTYPTREEAFDATVAALKGINNA